MSGKHVERKRDNRVKTALMVTWTVIIIMIISAGSDEQPVTVGEGILPDEDFIDIDTLIVDAVDEIESFSYEFPIVTSGAQHIFAGETSELRIESIFRFTPPLTEVGLSPDTVRNAELFEASLFLQPSYYAGDSTEVIPLYLHEVISGWSTADFNKYVYESVNREKESIDDSMAMLGDTNATVFRLPRELMLKWAQQGDQSIISPGLILKSDDTANGIVGFHGPAGDNAPVLRIIYGTEGAQDTVSITQTVRAFAGYLKKDFNLRNNIILQAGVSTRSVVRFDISQIPEGAFIHNAELELTRNPDLSLSHPEVGDSLFAHQLIDPNKLTIDLTDRAGFTVTETDTVLTYTALVGDFVQRWVTIEENKGFVIRYHSETLGLHRASFYTEAEDNAAKRPRLKIIYSRM